MEQRPIQASNRMESGQSTGNRLPIAGDATRNPCRETRHSCPIARSCYIEPVRFLPTTRQMSFGVSMHRRRSLIAILVFASLVLAMPAQVVRASMKSVSVLVAKGTQTQQFPANKDMGSRVVLFGGTSLYWAQLHGGTSPVLSVQSAVRGSISGDGKTGVNKILFRVVSASGFPVDVKLNLKHTMTVDLPASSVKSYAVDVGNNGTVEFSGALQRSGTATKSLAVTIPAKGLDIAVRTLAYITFARPTLDSKLTITVDAPRKTCFAAAYGTSCATASVRRPVRDSVDLDLAGGFRSAPGFLALGTRVLAVPLPRSSCRQLTDLGVLLPIRTDAAGRSTVKLTIPSAFTGLGRVQFLTWQAPGGRLDIDRQTVCCCAVGRPAAASVDQTLRATRR